MILIERAETLLILLQKRIYWQNEVFGKEEEKRLWATHKAGRI